jgi:hypothetical protein
MQDFDDKLLGSNKGELRGPRASIRNSSSKFTSSSKLQQLDARSNQNFEAAPVPRKSNIKIIRLS